MGNLKILPGNYLVTGAAGQMGTFALLRLRNVAGCKVKAAYHLKKPRVVAANITPVKADLKNADDCKKLAEGMDFVFMFAGILSTAPVMAKNPVSHVTANMIMSAQMLEAAYWARVKKIVWLSSSTAYPLGEGELTEDNIFDGDPPDVYFSVGWMTRYTEILCKMYATRLKNPVPIAILRPTTIYSEYEDFNFETCHVLPALVRKVVQRHKPIEVWGSGKQEKDIIYGDDVLDACFLALEKVKVFDAFNIGGGSQYSIDQLLKIIIDIDNYKEAEVIHTVSPPATVDKRTISFKKAREVLGFQAQMPIKQGIARMIARCKSLE